LLSVDCADDEAKAGEDRAAGADHLAIEGNIRATHGKRKTVGCIELGCEGKA
jgi:hypothetical protein